MDKVPVHFDIILGITFINIKFNKIYLELYGSKCTVYHFIAAQHSFGACKRKSLEINQIPQNGKAQRREIFQNPRRRITREADRWSTGGKTQSWLLVKGLSRAHKAADAYVINSRTT